MALTIADYDEAIAKVRDGGQSFTLGDMTYTAANLSQLVQAREAAIQEEQRDSGERPLFRGCKFGSMGY